MDFNELKMRLFEAKWNWLVTRTYEQTRVSNAQLESEASYAEEYDRWIKDRVEFMYDYLDFDNDRSRIRSRFLEEMHKKTTVKDIGDKLDEFTLSSKAAIAEYWDFGKHVLEQPTSPQKDHD